MATCELCTGTHYLSDDPALGPCVCCTPEAMQRRDRTIKELCEPRSKSADELLDELEASIGTIRDDLAVRGREARQFREEVSRALAKYFVAIGLPREPVTIEQPELWALYVLIETVADVAAD